jgi:hypothetical protein
MTNPRSVDESEKFLQGKLFSELEPKIVNTT